MAGAKLDWTGVIPAATTQFDEGLAVDLDATQTVLDGLITQAVSQHDNPQPRDEDLQWGLGLYQGALGAEVNQQNGKVDKP